MKKMSPLIKIFTVIFVCSGIAFLGLLAGGEHTKAQAKRDHDIMKGYYGVPMPRYPGAKEYPLSQEMAVGQSPMKMSYFVTRDDPLKVARYYADRWRVANYHVTNEVTLVGGNVSAMDIKTGVIRQVIITKQSEDRYMVFPSVTRQPHAVKTSVAGKLGLGEKPPVFPGSEGVMSFGSDDPKTNTKVTRFVNFGGMKANVDFYKNEMASRGWTLRKLVDELPVVGKKHQLLIFQKGLQEVTVNFTSVSEESDQVRVHITHVKTR